MSDILPLVDARRIAARETQSALPNSPVVPDLPKRDLRLRIGLAIRKLAGRIDPLPAPSRPRAPHRTLS